jgi:NitT/TauT family transport system ATP-binding protein
VPYLELQDLRKQFGSFTALGGVSLSLEEGEFLSLLGPSGCGKTTALRIIAGFLQPDSGRVVIGGEDMTSHAPNRRDIGMVFQAYSLFPNMTAAQNVAFGLKVRKWPGAKRDARVGELLEIVGLSHAVDRYPHQLSGGMRKRVSLAQTLVLDPDIILMDEPFSALDVQTRQLMENELLALWAEKKKAVLFITHDLDEAIAMSDRVVCLSAGPGSHPIGEFAIDLPRPRDVAEVRATPRFVELHQAIWSVLREEVLAGYRQQLAA